MQHRFNSKLVRLKETSPTQAGITTMRFNSKLVRLKAISGGFCRCASYYAFQFQTGSIKSSKKKRMTDARISVSIPNWFD